jgi:hypothetical protein
MTSRFDRPPGQKPAPISSKVDTAARTDHKIRGAVAQLGERCVRNAEVGGSNPLGSTILGVSWSSLPATRNVPESHPELASKTSFPCWRPRTERHLQEACPSEFWEAGICAHGFLPQRGLGDAAATPAQYARNLGVTCPGKTDPFRMLEFGRVQLTMRRVRHEEIEVYRATDRLCFAPG